MSLDNVNNKIIKALKDKVKILEEQVDCLRLLISVQQSEIDCYKSIEEIRETSKKLIDKYKKNNEK